MNDVVPDGRGGWSARCECGLTARYAEQADAWTWLIDHLCVEASVGTPA